VRGLVHPKLIDKLAPAFFPDRASIEANVPTRSPSGAPIAAWSAVAGLRDIPAAVSPQIFSRAGERRTAEITTAETTHRIGLAGTFPQITASMRLVIAGGNHAGIYDILRPDLDSQSGLTVLEARIATPIAAAGV
jgi:head-tail adaptor